MRPLAILTGFVLGSAVSITLTMGVVGLLFFVLAPDYPQVRAEIRPWLSAAALFLCLTAASALGFIGLLRRRPWAWIAQLSMWAVLALIAFYFWP